MSTPRDANGMPVGLTIGPNGQPVDYTTTTGPQTNVTQKGPERTGIDLSDPAYGQAVHARTDANLDEQTALRAQEEEARRAAVREEAAAAETIRVKADLQTRKDAAVAAHQAEQGQLREQLHAADAEKNKGYWDDKSTVARVLSAVLLGAAEGANTQGGQSAAGQILDKKVAEDRALKMQRFESAKERVGESQAVHQQNLALMDSQQIVSLQKIADNLDLAAKKFPAKAVALQLTAAQARQKAADIDAKGQIEVADRVTAPTTSTTQEGARVTSVQGDKGGAGAKSPIDLTALDLNGKPYGNWRTMPEAEKGRIAQSSATGLLGALDALKQHVITEGRSGNVPGGDAKAVRDGMISDATSYLTQVYNSGTLNQGEYERYKSQLNTSLLRGGDATAKGLDAIIAGVNRNYDAKLKGEAIRAGGGPTVQHGRDMSAVVDKLNSLPKGSPERPRWEALKKKIQEEASNGQP